MRSTIPVSVPTSSQLNDWESNHCHATSSFSMANASADIAIASDGSNRFKHSLIFVRSSHESNTEREGGKKLITKFFC